MISPGPTNHQILIPNLGDIVLLMLLDWFKELPSKKFPTWWSTNIDLMGSYGIVNNFNMTSGKRSSIFSPTAPHKASPKLQNEIRKTAARKITSKGLLNVKKPKDPPSCGDLVRQIKQPIVCKADWSAHMVTLVT